jgi:hypothetical protein
LVGKRIETFSILTYLFIMHLDCSALTPALSLREREGKILVLSPRERVRERVKRL